ncbi:MAG: GNAT family N-acetyltransferase [Deltaproteobacteria bacterium]|nr:GNAT family N-acetyltransferase [Deltaproteobacteria bacterium]
MERYHLTRSSNSDGYDLSIAEVSAHEPRLIPVLSELDLLSYAEPTFSRYSIGGLLRFGRVFVIRADELVIGACHTFRSFDDPDEVVVFNMALRPGWRGHGLGTRLLRGVLECLGAHGVKRVSLAVATNNHRAIAVYRAKFGFADVARLPNEFNNAQEYLLMRLDLAEWASRKP